jgi:hypothetical protein
MPTPTKDFVSLGNVNRLTVQPEDTRAELYSSLDAAAGLYAAATTRRKVTLSATSNEFSIENLAMVLMGEKLYHTQTADAVTAESLSSAAKKGAYYKLAYRNVSSLVVKQGTVTLVADTDYSVINSTLGLIRLLSTGAATEAAALTVDYAKAAITGTSQPQIAQFTKSEILGSLLFYGDSASGPSYDGQWFKCSVKPEGELPLIEDEFGEFTLTFDVLSDTAGTYGGSSTYPYGKLTPRGSAVGLYTPDAANCRIGKGNLMFARATA